MHNTKIKDKTRCTMTERHFDNLIKRYLQDVYCTCHINPKLSYYLLLRLRKKRYNNTHMDTHTQVLPRLKELNL